MSTSLISRKDPTIRGVFRSHTYEYIFICIININSNLWFFITNIFDKPSALDSNFRDPLSLTTKWLLRWEDTNMVSTNTLWDILIVHKTSTNGLDHIFACSRWILAQKFNMNLKCDAQTRLYHCYHHERHPLSLLSSIDLVLYRRMYLQAIIHDVQSCIYVDSLSNSPVWMRFIGLDAIYSIFIK